MIDSVLLSTSPRASRLIAVMASTSPAIIAASTSSFTVTLRAGRLERNLSPNGLS
eukprot:CAMPEP_0179289108 /NCGR_PEP_ID=MMETSP0797-20121207/41129_1 /TAXON_ID=47934 /ORGANISM="Dinophysis acuminata, Strain DAEP01" /LENGTH=54 /DNA_ID=CAMNT_0020998097 /DNA_START=10 /DNA_END=171 /DNA_ORIENTATION=+